MPPQIKITKEDIIKTALDIVRHESEEALNARNIAAALNCSTQPIFSNFANMDELFQAVVNSAFELYLSFLKREAESGEYPIYKAIGMGYIRFANEEKQLFKLLFMRDRAKSSYIPTSDFDYAVSTIMESNGISKETAELVHLEMWSCVHGIATMLATSFLSLEWQLISDMISDVYYGIRIKHLGGSVNECN